MPCGLLRGELTRGLSRNSRWDLGYGERRCGFDTKHQSTKAPKHHHHHHHHHLSGGARTGKDRRAGARRGRSLRPAAMRSRTPVFMVQLMVKLMVKLHRGSRTPVPQERLVIYCPANVRASTAHARRVHARPFNTSIKSHFLEDFVNFR